MHNNTCNTITTTHLANNVTIVSRAMPNTHSAALGAWILNGGRHQTAEQAGYAHLLEHLLFKGCEGMDALTMARRFEAMGGQINAHTGRELTALHGLVPEQNLLELLDMFITMLITPRFNERDLAVEREVVLQEMAMIEDTPEEAMEESAIELAWPHHPLGWPILGRQAVVENATAEGMHDYLRSLLTGNRLWIIAAGAVDHAALVQACTRLAALPPGTPPMQPAPIFTGGHHRARQDLTQSHLLWSMAAPSVSDERYPALVLANHLLGGGVSSRLFQEIREQRGLAYAIQSRLELYSDCGLWLIQTACEPDRAQECHQAVEDTLLRLMRNGPDADEVENSRNHLRASMLIAEDDPEENMERLAREAIYLKRHPTMEERLAQLAEITPETVMDNLSRAWSDTLNLEWSP